MSQISSSSSLNYMDKVPVKISEKYKPPPKIPLSYNNINQRLNNLNDLLESDLIKYDFSLERNVLIKIREWKTVRNKERENRRERMRKYELNRLREIEEKQKQLLTAVSYPSTDELSSDDEEPTEQAKTTKLSDSAGARNGIQSKDSTTTVINAGSTAGTNASGISGVNTGNVQFSPSHQNFNTILTPTVVPDPVLNSIHNDVHNSINYKINYSDFENDTSSPFDNIELKTINDLDILAQVLNISTQKHSNISNLKNDDANTNLSNITSDISSKSATSTAITVDNNTKIDDVVKTEENQSNRSANNVSNLNDNYQYSNLAKITNDSTSSEYYYNSSSKTDGIADVSSHILLSNANNFYPTSSNTQQQQFYNSTLNAITTTTANMNEIISRRNIDFYNLCNNLPNNQNYDNYFYRNYPLDYGNYSNNPHHTVEIDSSNNSFHNQDVNTYQQTASYTVTPNQNTLHSIYNGHNIPNTASTTIFGLNSSNKSKSVPDILKELNDEIRDSEMKRNERRRYQDLESYENRQLLMGNSSSNKKYDTISDTFMKLSPSSQILAKNISLMGFPLERVCKIAEMYGNDDKKIVEHLIPLSELLDLGFDETKISEALIKFDNNKEKALDFLIS